MRLHKAGGDQHLARDGLQTGRARLRCPLPAAPHTMLVSCAAPKGGWAGYGAEREPCAVCGGCTRSALQLGLRNLSLLLCAALPQFPQSAALCRLTLLCPGAPALRGLPGSLELASLRHPEAPVAAAFCNYIQETSAEALAGFANGLLGDLGLSK